MRKRILTVLATAAAFAGLVGAAATPAAAAGDWINTSQVLSITNPKTALSKDTWAGTVQVRYGTYEGRQYGWGRVLNPASGYNLVFEVDTNGNRVPDGTAENTNLPGGGTHWTAGHRTASNSNVAFRACIVSSALHSCAGATYKTGWW